MLLRTWHAFFSRGEDGVFHCEDCCFVSGSQLYSHDSSPVMTLDRKLGSCLTNFCSSVHTWTQWSHWSLIKRWRKNFAAIRLMISSSARMRWHDLYDSPMWLQTSWIVCLLSSRITSRTFSIISSDASGHLTRMFTTFHRFPAIFETLKPLKCSCFA